MAILDDIGDVLSSGGVGTVGVSIFKGTMPSTPDAVIALYETGGPAPVHAMAKGPGTALVERPHVQVLSRDLRADSARKTLQDANRLLDALGRTINGVRYLSVFAIQPLFFLERDETNRMTYACNYEILRVPSSSS